MCHRISGSFNFHLPECVSACIQRYVYISYNRFPLIHLETVSNFLECKHSLICPPDLSVFNTLLYLLSPSHCVPICGYEWSILSDLFEQDLGTCWHLPPPHSMMYFLQTSVLSFSTNMGLSKPDYKQTSGVVICSSLVHFTGCI